ncbi:M14 family metallocarboxypeptidase [Metabacillus litoralis]|uniref:M14 family metallopeptidase n=1 Tax=Metabacillus litoralis TaxID=152268 RepID=UPI001CFE9B32|nr:M14 family metallocarboxypeptidase [Metabacillus litoralis]
MFVRVKKAIPLKELANHLKLNEQLLVDSNRDKRNRTIDENEIICIPDAWKKYIQNNLFVDCEVNQTKSSELTTKKPYNSVTLEQDIEKLQLQYPFINKQVIGYSVLNTPIYELTIGHGKKKIHMNGSFHANEWITTSVIMHWFQNYLEALVNDHDLDGQSCIDLYNDTKLSLVPMVNPDGVDLVLNGLPDHIEYEPSLLQMNDLSIDFSQWKANIRGIDLNNQYPVKWEIEKARKLPKAPAPRDYPGDAPLTEPEAIALAELVKRSQFDRVLAFHTQGEEIYWGYLRKEPVEAEEIVKEFNKLSGYKAVRDIDSHAGFRDWFVNDWRRSGFTIELGIGTNPLPFSQFDEIYRKSKGIFLAALYM